MYQYVMYWCKFNSSSFYTIFLFF